MAKSFRKDLTTGSVTKGLIHFATPFLLSNLLQALYSVVDMIVVGQMCGKAGITGVSIGGQINMLITGAVNGLAMSGTVLVAQYIGAKRYEDERKTIGTLSTLHLVLSVIVTVIMLLCGAPLLRAMHTPENAFHQTLWYLNICMIGLVFMFGYNAVGAVLRGMGDSKRPLYFVIIATVVNIILDIVFVGPFKMEAAGAALATVIAQAISFILSIAYLIKNKFFTEYKASDFKMNKKHLKLILQIGLPSAFQSFIVSVSFLILMSLVNSLPNADIASACQGVGSKITAFAILPGLAVSSAIAAMAGQNIGAGEFERAKKTMYVGMGLALAVSTIVFLIVEIFPAQLFRMFTDDPEVIKTGISFIRLVAIDYIIVCIMFCYNGLAIGAGQTSYALFNATFNAIATRIPLSYFAVYYLHMGLDGVGLGMGLASVVTVFFGMIYVKSGRWKKSKVDLAN